MIRKLILTMMLCAAVAPQCLAQASKSQEVNIESDQMEIIEKENRAIFTGKVNAVRSDVKLTSDSLTVLYADVKQQDGTSKTEVSKLDATGNVNIVTATQKITGQWAKMDVKANTLTVGGNVRVVQGQTILNGGTLNVDLNTDRSQMTGGRVKGSFVPQ